MPVDRVQRDLKDFSGAGISGNSHRRGGGQPSGRLHSGRQRSGTGGSGILYAASKEQLVEVLGTLTEREQKVLRLRFGLDDGRARTLEEVGKEFNVTRERIRQIEAKALQKAAPSQPQPQVKGLSGLR